MQIDSKKSVSIDHSEEGEKELYSEPLHEMHHPLAIYFKTINRFPLLNGEEEKKIATHIKENEERYKKLVVKWRKLCEKEFLKRYSPKKINEIRRKLEQANDVLSLFEDLTRLEKTRKKAECTIKRIVASRMVSRDIDKLVFLLPISIHVVILTPNLHDFVRENSRDFWTIPR